MGWVHRMLSVDAEAMTGVCANCGPVDVKLKHNGNGTTRYACGVGQRETYTTPAARERRRRWRAQNPASDKRAHRRFVGDACEHCGFVPEHMAQLDVHHRDGNRNNNALPNLQTLCANCHRLVHREAA